MSLLAPDTRQEVRDQRRDFLVERTRVALWVLMGGTLVFAFADALLAPAHLASLWAVKATAIVFFAIALRAFRVGRVPRWSASLALTSTALGYLVAASAAAILGHLEVSMMLCGVIALGLAAGLPWGVGMQLMHVALGAMAILVSAAGLAGSGSVLFGYSGVVVGVLFLASLYLAYETRRLTEQQAEAYVDKRNQDYRLRLIVQQMPAALWSTDLQLRVTSVMGAGLRSLGIRPEVPLSLGEYFGSTDPEFPPIAAHRAALRGESKSYELVWMGHVFEAHVEPFRAPDGSITGTLGVAVDQTDLKEAQERGATLLEIARDISGTLDRQQILDRVARRAVRSLMCDALMVFYWDGERRRYRVISHHGLPDEWAAETEALEISAEAPLVQHLERHHSAVIEGSEAQNLIQPALLKRFNIAAVAAAQLSVGHRGLGALLALRFKGSSSFTPAQRELLEGIARHVAIAVEVADLHDSVKKEGEVSAALARAGRELIASLDPPELMKRLSRITTETLAADSSCTFMLDPREQVYAPVASYGIGDEAWESLRLLHLPHETLASLIDRLEANEIVQFVPAEQVLPPPLGRLVQQHGLAAALYVGLRRGDRLIGFQVAHLHAGAQRFGRQQSDILRGIGGLASLALENAFLMSELARANSIKSDFVATMSHELRTPLNAIIGYNLLMRDGEFGAMTGEQLTVCDHIDRSSKTLLDLVSATLDVSRLDAGQVGLNLGEFSLSGLLNAMRGEMEKSNGRRVPVDWDVAEGLPTVYSDQLKLKVILKNLIENALKFTDHGYVRIGARSKDDGIELTVSDTGIGIPPEAQTAVFEAFKQLDSSSTRRHGGVGLGLYIVRRLVDMLGGSIGLSSEPGRGATFCIWIPLRFGEGAVTKPVLVT